MPGLAVRRRHDVSVRGEGGQGRRALASCRKAAYVPPAGGRACGGAVFRERNACAGRDGEALPLRKGAPARKRMCTCPSKTLPMRKGAPTVGDISGRGRGEDAFPKRRLTRCFGCNGGTGLPSASGKRWTPSAPAMWTSLFASDGSFLLGSVPAKGA